MAIDRPTSDAQRRIEDARRTGATSLDLCGLGLTSVSESLGHLTGLQRLDLSKNKLASVPESLGQLSELQVLNLHSNRLTTLPKSLGSLARLRDLYLSDNRLTAVPESIVQLMGLRWLNLSSNRLTVLPESLGQLTELRELYLSDNLLTSIPDSLGRLAMLQRLYLDNNRLAAVPESLGQLAGLQRLLLHNNPELGIPPEIFGPTLQDIISKEAVPAKPTDILQYYFRSRQEQRRRLNEAKVLIVGQGGVGKTSLVNQLVHDTYNPHEAKTEGINIATWQVPGTEVGSRAAEPIMLNVWDFGGQEIMHATHQFFLTKRSLYLVVLDARKGENESNIHYWLKIIQSYGGDAPVLIVTNKTEAHQLELNETRLRKDYAPNLRGFFKTSCATGAGIADLRTAIAEEIHALPHVFDELPLSYFETKEKLAALARTKNFLDQAEYVRLCKKHGVKEPRDQGVLIRFLHDLGTVLNFDDPDSPYDLRDVNILNPEWVTGGVYKILNSIELMRREGVLETAQLGGILGAPSCYPPERHKFLIEMMRKFELCFEFPDSHGQRLLVPELLRPNEPELDWQADDALNFQYHYNVLPGGIISRFIVKTHHNLTDKPTYWRSGVVLEIDGNKALVRGDTEARRVFISVRGPERGRRRALSVIRDAFKAIHDTIPKIVAEEKVPLPGNLAVVVDYQHLLRLEKRGTVSFLPEGSEREYSVQKLLDGIEDKDQRMARRDRRTEVGLDRDKARSSKRDKVAGGKTARPKVDVKTLLIVGFFFLFAIAVLIGGLALVSTYVASNVAMTAITIAGVLFTVLFFAFLALFTGMFGEEVTERIVHKILDKVPLLQSSPPSKPAKKGKL